MLLYGCLSTAYVDVIDIMSQPGEFLMSSLEGPNIGNNLIVQCFKLEETCLYLRLLEKNVESARNPTNRLIGLAKKNNNIILCSPDEHL